MYVTRVNCNCNWTLHLDKYKVIDMDTTMAK